MKTDELARQVGVVELRGHANHRATQRRNTEMAAKYSDGIRVAQLAEEYGVSKARVYQGIHEHNARVRAAAGVESIG